MILPEEGAPLSPTTTPDSGPSRDFAATGVVRHRGHWVDLILEQGASADMQAVAAFDQIARDLIAEIRAKEIELLNEKIDGAPAIVFGFDQNDQPFVAYKLDVERASGPQRLIRSRTECNRYFAPDNPVGQILAEAIVRLGPALQKWERKDLTFQADLLFTPVSGEKATDPETGALKFKPNRHGIEYVLPEGTKFHPFAETASIGLAIHTVGSRKLGAESRLEIGSSTETSEIESLLKTIRSPEIFAVDPWSRHVRIDQQMDRGFTEERSAKAESLLHSIQEKTSSLSIEFQAEWKRLLPHLKIFFNSSLKNGHSGGIYRAAFDDDPFDLDRIVDKFRAWVGDRIEHGKRSPKWVAAKFDELSQNHPEELGAICEAYYDAVRLQYLLKPHMEEAYRSKLGGGRIEGVILQFGETVVKLVDRLDFTMLNFQGEAARAHIRELNRRAKQYEPVDERKKFASLETLPAPFNNWHPDAVFVMMKGQPPHTGHIELIKQAVQKAGGAPVYVIASDKAPDLRAAEWKRFGASERMTDLKNHDYTYFLDKRTREEMLRLAVGAEAKIHLVSPQAFWAYVSRAMHDGAEGQIHLAIGAKEVEEGRYSKQLLKYRSHLAPMVIDMQKEGISATEVRAALKAVALEGDFQSEQLLRRAFEFIPEDGRDAIIDRVIAAWKKVDKQAARFRVDSGRR